MANALEAEMPEKAETVNRKVQPASSNQSDQKADLQRVADELIARHIDITNAYRDWLHLGFAIADALGEDGRQLFHDLSRQCPKYDEAECDKQYTHCLNGRGSGVTVKTFFQMAKDAGIELCANNAKMPSGTNGGKCREKVVFDDFDDIVQSGTMTQLAQTEINEESKNVMTTLENTFSDKLRREDLPPFLQRVYDSQEDAVGRDKMLLGVLCLVSIFINTAIYAIYDGRKVFAALYLIIFGRFATSKGDLEAVRQVAAPIKNEMRHCYEQEKSNYEMEMAAWESKGKKERGPEPKEPVFTSPFVSANSSASAVYRSLDANGGWGLIFETEADTLSIMLSKSEYGDYTDLLRKAHHHENIAMKRVVDNINIEIEKPRLAVFLTCTGSQLKLLLPPGNVSNGLASRFLFYALPDAKLEFRDVFARGDDPIEDIYKRLGDEFLPLYHELQEREDNPIQFVLSKEQQKRFITMFDGMLKEQFAMLGDGIQGFIYRIALECFRIAMVLSVLRRLGEWNKEDDIFDSLERALTCDERDFNAALIITECLVSHTARVYAVLCSEDNDPFRHLKEQPKPELRQLYAMLPSDCVFRTSEVIDAAKKLNISERTAKRMLGQMWSEHCVVVRLKQGYYQKKS